MLPVTFSPIRQCTLRLTGYEPDTVRKTAEGNETCYCDATVTSRLLHLATDPSHEMFGEKHGEVTKPERYLYGTFVCRSPHYVRLCQERCCGFLSRLLNLQSRHNGRHFSDRVFTSSFRTFTLSSEERMEW